MIVRTLKDGTVTRGHHSHRYPKDVPTILDLAARVIDVEAGLTKGFYAERADDTPCGVKFCSSGSIVWVATGDTITWDHDADCDGLGGEIVAYSIGENWSRARYRLAETAICEVARRIIAMDSYPPPRRHAYTAADLDLPPGAYLTTSNGDTLTVEEVALTIVIDWNDAPERKADEVASLFRLVAAELRDAG